MLSPGEQELYTYLIEEKHLSKEGAEAFIREYSKLSDHEKSMVIYEAVGKEVYKEMPESINTFLDDPYFMGGLFNLFKIWRDLLNEIYPSPLTKRYDEAILSVATRCFGKGTLVRLRDGNVKAVEDVKIGDVLVGPDNKKRVVKSLSRGSQEMYKVTPTNGSNPFICNKAHILSLYDVKNQIYKDIELSEFLNLSEREKSRLYLYYSNEIEYEAKKTEDDPYLFGFLLKGIRHYTKIPQEYMQGSVSQRKRLLAGILDMKCGDRVGITNRIDLYSDNEDILKDYEELARSLGFAVYYIDKKTIEIHGNLKKLPLKLLKIKEKGNEPLSLTDFTIEPIGINEYYGFEVDGDHRFLLDNYMVVHNSGKTFVSSLSILYEIYLLTCLKNPTKFLSSSNIVIALLSKDNSTAVSQLGTEVYKGLTQAPCFKETIRSKLSFSRLEGDGVPLTDYLLLRAGSALGTVVGTNLYAGCLDEANMPSPRVSAENLVDYRLKIYHEMLDRRAATFSKAPKRSGIIWLTSSPTDEGDVISERIDEVQKAGLDNVIIRENIPRWEAREEGISQTFQFFLGSDTKDPCIVDEYIELKPEELDRVISIPYTTNYYNEFLMDPYRAIQNIAGRRTMPETALFNTVSIFDKVFYKDNDIFRSDLLNIPMDRGISVDDYLYDPTYFSHPNRPECFRYIHLDMAYSSDKFGIASVYSDRVKYVNPEDMHEMLIRKYFVDFCLGVISPKKEKVDIIKVLEWVYSLKERGYPIKLVTTDNHQGEIARQFIKKHGVKTDYLSMETDKEKYLNLKNLIITESLEGYKNPDLIRDLRGLRESQKKIEKGKGYSDDLSNALGGALWSCCQDRFYKRNNETITELINQSGKMYVSNGSPRLNGFSGISSQINNINRSNGMGFNYRY